MSDLAPFLGSCFGFQAAAWSRRQAANGPAARSHRARWCV